MRTKVQRSYIDVNTFANSEANCKAKMKVGNKAMFARGDKKNKNERMVHAGTKTMQIEWREQISKKNNNI